jgi:hypothetical protein
MGQDWGAMRIDRRPNRGPYAAALICLLMLCLTIPLCWRSKTERAEPHDAGSAWADYERRTLTLGNDYFPMRRATYGKSPQLGSEDLDTLDELLFELANRPVRSSSDRPDLFDEYIVAHSASDGVDASAGGIVWQYVANLLHTAGYELAKSTPAIRLSAIVPARSAAERPTPNRADTLPTFSLKLTNPRERLAMLPRSKVLASRPVVDAIAAPWSSPTVLLARLAVLAEHPHSRDWAQVTIAELKSLTSDDHPNPTKAASQLATLESLSTEARTLAEATTDGRLKAELLRAHWGLERRLDCWSLMHDIAVASAAENRFAARETSGAGVDAFAGQGTVDADLHALSTELEAYEAVRAPRLARVIVKRQRLLAESAQPRQQELANEIEQNYRNANVRLAISGELLQRFVPKQQSETSRVHERIAGTPVRGQSVTNSDNHIRLEPDAHRWHVNLETDGTVDSDTVADGGQVKVYSLGNTTFSARKSVVVDREGVEMGPSSADAQNSSQLVGVRSNFDWMPMVNDMVRTRAIEEYHKKRLRAEAEVECRVEGRVEQQLDERADRAVQRVQQQMREQVSDPLAAAGVELTPIELSTTKQRVIARLRVAGADQLAGHTPRPRAPSDSLASVQVHESALTNAAASLSLDGKRLTAVELQELVRAKLARTNQPPATVVEGETVFDFAPEDAVQFRVANEKLELILSLREVEYDGDAVRNFRVHAFYVPAINGLEAEFVRDGALGIEGRVGSGDRARVHNIFNKVLSEDRKLPIVRLNDPQDVRLAGLMITQLVLEDGWIGLALGPGYPERTAERSRVLR